MRAFSAFSYSRAGSAASRLRPQDLPDLNAATYVSRARELSGIDTRKGNVGWAHRLGARVVFLELGADGVIVSDGAKREKFPGVRVQTVDATGAGDCFCGAALARLAAGDTIWEAARYANAAAALATTGYGAVDPLPRPAEVRKLL